MHQGYVDATTERKFFISISCFPTTGCYSDTQVCENQVLLYKINTSRLVSHQFSKSQANNYGSFKYRLWILLQITTKLLTEAPKLLLTVTVLMCTLTAIPMRATTTKSTLRYTCIHIITPCI